MPAPNFFAGLLIGIANSSWLAVVLGSLIWGVAFCAYVAILGGARRDSTIASFAARGRRLMFGSPVVTFYVIEYATGALTALVVGLITFWLKHLF